MTTQNDPLSRSNPPDPAPPVDDSDPTGHYHSSAAGQVQQNVAQSAEPEPAPEADETAAPTEPEAPQDPTERFPWMKDTRQWGTRAQLTPHGLTVGSIMTGLYGDIPEESREMTRMPRGSFATPGMPGTICRISLKPWNWPGASSAPSWGITPPPRSTPSACGCTG